MANKKDILIEIDGLKWGYPESPSLIFDNFNLKLHKNDFCFVVGRSGVGKTTLIKFLIRQLIPPKRMIFHNKEDLARLTAEEVQKYRRKIGVMYQDFKLIESKTVRENIEYPLEILGRRSDKINEKVDEVLQNIGLMDKKDIQVPKLSGGEKQRVAIARALATEPEFIIADEPTGNLDKEVGETVADTLIDLNKKGNTILFITHDMDLLNYVDKKHKIKKVNLG